MESEERITAIGGVKQVDEFAENKAAYVQEKKPRKRRTAEERRQELEAKRAKCVSEIEQYDAQLQRLSLTPAERKAEKKRIEDSCKIKAGLIAFELYRKGTQFFTAENFKTLLLNQVDQPLEINFINRQFKEQGDKR